MGFGVGVGHGFDTEQGKLFCRPASVAIVKSTKHCRFIGALRAGV